MAHIQSSAVFLPTTGICFCIRRPGWVTNARECLRSDECMQGQEEGEVETQKGE
jgi:hypothetical protein